MKRAALVLMIDVNPFDDIGETVKAGAADAWTAAMVALWKAGLWILRASFKILDRFLTPDVADGGLAPIYQTCMWISLVLALCLAFGQIGLAVVRRDGATLGRTVLGVAQYGAIVTCWIAVCAAIIYACSGLTIGILEATADVPSFDKYGESAQWPEQVGGAVASTALGISSIFLLFPAAIGYVLIMLVREAGLLVLVITLPISAAGVLHETTKAWFWKSLRWFLAASFMAPLMALILGLGVQISYAAFPNGPDTETLNLYGAAEITRYSAESQVGMAIVGCVLIVISCFCPMALFRLLAFVDPGTSSGAQLRTSLAANGGIGGVLSGGSSSSSGSGAATQSGSDGRSGGEDAADSINASRFLPRALGKGVQTMGHVAQKATSLGVDVANQAGVGEQSYYDSSAPPGRGGGGLSVATPARKRKSSDADSKSDGGSANDPVPADVAPLADDAVFLG